MSSLHSDSTLALFYECVMYTVYDKIQMQIPRTNIHQFVVVQLGTFAPFVSGTLAQLPIDRARNVRFNQTICEHLNAPLFRHVQVESALVVVGAVICSI